MQKRSPRAMTPQQSSVCVGRGDGGGSSPHSTLKSWQVCARSTTSVADPEGPLPGGGGRTQIGAKC